MKYTPEQFASIHETIQTTRDHGLAKNYVDLDAANITIAVLSDMVIIAYKEIEKYQVIMEALSYLDEVK